MPDELVDICDESNHLTGVQKMKSEVHRDGSWHRVAHVWIYNTQGEMLLQLRAKDKEFFPNVWDISVAGHVGANEDPVISAQREVREEIGLTVDSSDLSFGWVRQARMVDQAVHDNKFCYVYFFQFDGDLSQLVIQKEEVQAIKWVSFAELREDLRLHPDQYVSAHGEYWQQAIAEAERRL